MEHKCSMSNALNNKIVELREAQNMSQADLAKALGVGQGQVSKLESGITQLTFNKAKWIAKQLGCKASDLLPDDDYRLKLEPTEEQLIKDYRRVNPLHRSHLLMHFGLIANTINAVSANEPEQEEETSKQ